MRILWTVVQLSSVLNMILESILFVSTICIIHSNTLTTCGSDQCPSLWGMATNCCNVCGWWWNTCRIPEKVSTTEEPQSGLPNAWVSGWCYVMDICCGYPSLTVGELILLLSLKITSAFAKRKQWKVSNPHVHELQSLVHMCWCGFVDVTLEYSGNFCLFLCCLESATDKSLL